MAKKSVTRVPKTMMQDFSSWNFILFLTLALILLVIVAVNVRKVSLDLRSRASGICPQITALPRPEDCPGGKWSFQRDTQGCERFFCETAGN